VPELRKRRDDPGKRAVPVAGDEPAIAIAPVAPPEMEEAVRAGGGRLVPPSEAEGLVWTNPGDPTGLGSLLKSEDPGWVQLPFAGIESFFEAGVIDDGRIWTCAKGIYGPACAEHALALLLAAARRLPHHARARRWTSEAGFGAPERRLTGATVLIVGTGGIGRALVPLLQPVGARMVAVNRSGEPLEGAEITETVQQLPHLLAEADYVVVGAASTADTRGLFDKAMLGNMKPSSWLINVARGDLVVTIDLVAALEEGFIAGAGLDVTDPEPLPDGHPLWEMENVLITPHVANTWDMAFPELTALIERNVAHFAAGEPLEGLVDVDLGY
jgi:phosphoglycerate dehydrogenase-like enzyme